MKTHPIHAATSREVPWERAKEIALLPEAIRPSRGAPAELKARIRQADRTRCEAAERAAGPTPDPTRELIRRALAGDVGAQRRAVDRMLPAIQKRIAATLFPFHKVVGGDLRAVALDLTQDTLFRLFAGGGLRLRRWDPKRGVPLEAFVARAGQNVARSFLRKRKNEAPREAVWDDVFVDDAADEAADPEEQAEDREQVESALSAVEARLSPKGREILELLLRQGLPVEEVARRTGLTENAVQIHRSRFLKMAEKAHGDSEPTDG